MTHSFRLKIDKPEADSRQAGSSLRRRYSTFSGIWRSLPTSFLRSPFRWRPRLVEANRQSLCESRRVRLDCQCAVKSWDFMDFEPAAGQRRPTQCRIGISPLWLTRCPE